MRSKCHSRELDSSRDVLHSMEWGGGRWSNRNVKDLEAGLAHLVEALVTRVIIGSSITNADRARMRNARD